MTDDERLHDDADETLAEQTVVRVRIPMVQLADGTYYVDVTTKPDKKVITDAVDLFGFIAEHSQGEVKIDATRAHEGAKALAYEYGLLTKPKPK